jgi:hypothetical protein
MPQSWETSRAVIEQTLLTTLAQIATLGTPPLTTLHLRALAIVLAAALAQAEALLAFTIPPPH